MEQIITPRSQRRSVTSKKSKQLLFLLLLFFLLLAVIIYFNSPISRINEIEIFGLELLSEEKLYGQADLQKNMQYLFTSTAKITEKLLELKELKEVTVEKHFPGQLSIKVVEQKPVAILAINDAMWQPLLENGYLFQAPQGKRQFLNYPIITTWRDQELLNRLASELAMVRPSTLTEISEIQQNYQDTDSQLLLMYTIDGYTLHMLLEDISNKLELYPAIITELAAKGAGPGNIYLLESIRYEEY